MNDKTCFYYMAGACYCRENGDRKCCDPTYECVHYKPPVPYIQLKSIYLTEVHGNGKRSTEPRATH